MAPAYIRRYEPARPREHPPADFSDVKSPYTIGHSRGVADLAGEAARVLGLGEVTATLVRRAGLVHDLGRLGVPNTIWDKPVPPARPAGREIEVLQLLARGLSNREIAERLVISRKTAGHHVEHIYAKTGTTNRALASLFAASHGLITDPAAEPGTDVTQGPAGNGAQDPHPGQDDLLHRLAQALDDGDAEGQSVFTAASRFWAAVLTWPRADTTPDTVLTPGLAPRLLTAVLSVSRAALIALVWA
jgi:DNA-binding CsgD family transcriptional regulator